MLIFLATFIQLVDEKFNNLSFTTNQAITLPNKARGHIIDHVVKFEGRDFNLQGRI